jgi:hypothetical protein
VTTERQTGCRARFWLIGAVVVVGIAWLLFCASRYTRAAEGTWPLAPANSDHPIANTFGELFQYRVKYLNGTISPPKFKQHQGVDILAIPFGDPNASEVIVSAEGKVSHWHVMPGDNRNEVRIRATDGAHQYTYIHLEHPAEASFEAAMNNGATVYPGAVMGKVRHVFPCGYDHLHYDVGKIVGNSEPTAINPLAKIRPNPDPIAPDITSVHLARHGLPRWRTFATVGNQPVVSGTVDIVAAVTDRDDAGSAAVALRSVGLYDLKWRACTSANPNCDWNDTHAYQQLPLPLDNYKELFSFECNLSFPYDCWKSVAEEWTDLTAAPEEYCPVGPSTYMVLRKGAGLPSWDTRELLNGSQKYRDGNYVLSVKALDYYVNQSNSQSDIYSVDVCVDNSPPNSC